MDLEDFENGILRSNMPLIFSAYSNCASEFYRHLIKWINDFHRDLDADHEVALQLVTFGEKITFHVEDIKYQNPSLISFTGKTGKGEPIELVQHVSQISLLLMKADMLEPEKPKRPIGFATWEDFDAQKN